MQNSHWPQIIAAVILALGAVSNALIGNWHNLRKEGSRSHNPQTSASIEGSLNNETAIDSQNSDVPEKRSVTLRQAVKWWLEFVFCFMSTVYLGLILGFILIKPTPATPLDIFLILILSPFVFAGPLCLVAMVYYYRRGIV